MAANPNSPIPMPAPIYNGGGGSEIRSLNKEAGKLNKLGDLTSSYANQALQNAFDPNQSIYNSYAGQLTDNMNSQEAERGIANTPYGAAVTGASLGNFANDWQTSQIAREAQGMNTAVQSGTPYTQAGTLLNEAGQLDISSVANMIQAYGIESQASIAMAKQIFDEHMASMQFWEQSGGVRTPSGFVPWV